ncbi:non-ribosomal peptide synthetase [Shouchella miscanthi]|uniref:non-ribosomal peptide synthetase n=1 Tax=Shouchella miscanthi TaxID=2598861 RepID=UPI0011A59D6C|nr:non-ribosomal peptide synthetase [Shouchella miscanthi]
MDSRHKDLISRLRERGTNLFLENGNITFEGELTAEEEYWVRNFSEEIIGVLIQEGKEFWATCFSDSSLNCDLPTFLNKRKSDSPSNSSYSFKLTTSELKDLKNLDEKGTWSYPTMFLTAWSVLLSRYTSQEKINFVTDVPSRHSEGGAGKPINIKVTKETSFLDINEALLYIDILYKKNYFPGVDWLENQMPEEYASKFNVSFSYLNNEENNNYNSDSVEPPLDLSLQVIKHSKGLKLKLLSKYEYFKKKDLERMSRHFRNILMELILDDKARVVNCSMMSSKEKRNLAHYHGEKRGYQIEKNIVSLFEETVEKNPNKLAVITDEDKVDYDTLNSMSNYIGEQLIECGVKEGSSVGVYVDRSIHTYIAMLGILKIGGVYVPLDASYPAEYITQITEDLNIKQFISKEKLLKFLPKQDGKIILVDNIEKNNLTHKKGNLGVKLNSHNPAVIMYTSGSTGIPKGVIHKQVQLLNRLNWMWENYPFNEDDVMCQRTALNFMPSMWELLGGLLQGIPTVIIPDKIVADPNRLLEFISEYKITYMMTVPSLLKMMYQSNLDTKQFLSSIRLCITAGEPLTSDIFNKFRDKFPNAILLNDFGSTETNGVLYYDSKGQSNSSTLPHFKTIANTEIYLLDKYLNQVPVGVLGDIYISGAPLALGYVNNINLNKQSFLTVPQISAEKTLYRLGDRARFLDDGTIQLFGRMDHQVKIRGKRVEIGHIETTINKHNKVIESAVVAKKTKNSSNQLYAYVVSKQEVSENELEEFLMKLLPDYMIPFKIEIIDSIPKKPNGKKNLTELINRSSSLTSTTHNKNTILESLKGITSRVLEVDINSVNTTKKLYAVGFDSVSIVDLSNQITKKMKILIEVTELYDCNNLEELANLIVEKENNTYQIDKDIRKTDSSSKEMKEVIVNHKPENLKIHKVDNHFETISQHSLTANKVINCAALILEIESKSININKKIYEVGFDSVSIVEFARKLSDMFNIQVTTTDLFNTPTLLDVIQLLEKESQVSVLKEKEEFVVKVKTENNMSKTENNSGIPSILKKHAADILQFELSDIDDDLSFEDLEFTPTDLTKYIKAISHNNNWSISFTDIIEHNSIGSLAKYLEDKQTNILGFIDQKKDDVNEFHSKDKESVSKKNDNGVELNNREIAIIGFSGKFPNALDINEYWKNLTEGNNAICEVPENRWRIEDYFDSNPQSPNKSYSKWGGFIPNVDKFDAQFFDISKHEAKLMDPQQRLCLEEAFKSLEHAGYSDRSLYSRNIGTYVGIRKGDYSTRLIRSGIENSSFNLTGNDSAILSARLAYILNLKGPTLAIDTACSSSLVAIHLACQSILNGEVEMAIAGGAHIMSSSDLHVTSSKMGMLSPKGLCKTFDDEADGFVPGEAVGFVVIKELQRAITDGDYIHAVIKGSGINQDGTTNGITAPSVDSQSELISTTLEKIKVDPETITMVEAHGTGTKLGDPIEVKALTEAFKRSTKKVQYSAIGSVKTNIGHAVAGAGIASLLKVIMSLKHQQIPKTLNFTNGNEHINFKESPFYVNTLTENWRTDAHLRRASVSSFGFSGTNCFMVVEEALKAHVGNKHQDPYYLITLSAKNETSLKQKVKDLYQWTKKDGHLYEMGDISYTLINGRSFYQYRISFIVSNISELEKSLLQIMNDSYEEINYAKCNGDHNSFKEEHESIVRIFESVKHQKYSSTEEFKLLLSSLSREFVEDNDLQWDNLFERRFWKTIPLPVYSFLEEYFWIEEPEKEEILSYKEIKKEVQDKRSFVTTINSTDVCVKEHKISNKKIVPAAMYIEFIRNCIEHYYKINTFRIENFVWLRPIEVQSQVEVIVELTPKNQHCSSFIIKVGNESHASGIVFMESIKRSSIDLNSLLLTDSNTKIDKLSCYRKFDERGINYGSSFQLIDSLSIGEDYIIGKLASKDIGSNATFLIDSVFQTAIGHSFNHFDPYPYMPYTIEKIKITEDFRSGVKVLVHKVDSKEKSKMRKYNISLLNNENNVVMEFKGFTQREYKVEPHTSSQQMVKLYNPKWEISELNYTELYSGNTLLIDVDNILTGLQDNHSSSNKVVLVKPGKAYKQVGQNEFIVDLNNKEELRNLLKKTGFVKIESIVYLSKTSIQSKYNSRSILDLFTGIQGLLEIGYQRKIKFLYTYVNISTIPQPQHEAVSGFLRVLEREYSGLKGKVIEIRHNDVLKTENVLFDIINQELSNYDSSHDIIYQKQNRLVKRYEESSLKRYNSEYLNTELIKQGVYIIAGGTGGLGEIFAQYLSRKMEAKIVLVGRRPYDNSVALAVEKIQSGGGEAIYYQCDISNRQQVANLINFTKNRFNKGISGIFQSVGVIKDSLFRNKVPNEIDKVLKPKIEGTLYLDELTKDEDIKCFVLFSSISPIMGNIGQSDYAYANSFLDAFAHKRELMRKQGNRSGKTISLNWPFWKDGGMGIDSNKKDSMEREFGLYDLESIEGIEAFEIAMGLEHPQLIVIKGEVNNLDIFLMDKEVENPVTNIQTNILEIEHVQKDLITLAQQILTSNEVIDVKTDLTEYGLNSITITEFSGLVSNFYGVQIPPSVFFEYTSLNSISEYLCEQHSGVIQKRYHGKPTENIKHFYSPELIRSNEDETGLESLNDESTNTSASIETTDIAIVGISAKFPGANTLEDFWNNLMSGKSAITEIPAERGDWKHSYKDLEEADKNPVNMGGVISDIDKFDPLFFNISPNEAKLMDPQQRILLQETWRALEDYGQKPSRLSGEDVGVFIGAFTSDYNDLLIKEGINEGHSVAGNDHSILANRISYSFNFKGPSEAIDTACSSSLVGLHRAIQSLKFGECKLAIVGGVNALLSPDGFIRATNSGMLSEGNKIKSFDNSADGYLRGEGCGVVVIKPLRNAIEDNDNIYSVIKGSAINHSGRSYGLTTPNINGQSDVIVKAMNVSRIPPESISYIEAHGTASKLGDSIEIDAFKKAFSQLSDTTNLQSYCGVGSVKPNIGHLEAASGMASLFKAILVLKHKQVPPTINFDQLNEDINLEQSPFYIVDQSKDLRSKAVDVNGEESTLKIGVHSFGFGGTNAHIILEEHISKTKQNLNPKYKHLIPISAKTKYSLFTYVSSFEKWLDGNRTISIEDIAYTLQNGREDMPERLIMIVTDIEDLIDQCQKYLNEEKLDYWYEGHVTNRQRDLDWILDKEILEKVIRKAIEEEDHKKIARLWVSGYSIQWEGFYKFDSVSRISLPTYEFATQSHWYKQLEEEIERDINHVSSKISNDQETLVYEESNKNLSSGISLVSNQIKQLLGIQSINPSEKLLNYGFDSIMAIKLKYLLEEELLLSIPLEILGKSTTIQEIQSYLDREINNFNELVKTSGQEKHSAIFQDDLTNADEETLIALFEKITNK